MNGLTVIPESRRHDAAAALVGVFGKSSLSDIRPIIGGTSGALIYRLEVGNRICVLRLEPERIRRSHRLRGMACMAAAAEIGVAPKVYFSDAESGITIMDWVAAKMLADHPGGEAGIARDLGELCDKIHGLAPFPMIARFPDFITHVLSAVAASDLLTPGALDRHLEELSSLRSIYPWDALPLVSSHNDPNPRNLLYDGERFWLVDWELAFLNDPMVDLAILSLDFATTQSLEEVLLSAALRRPPDKLVLAKLRVMRQFVRLYYGAIVLTGFSAATRPEADPSLRGLTLAEFLKAKAQGTLKSGTSEIAYAVAKMHLRSFSEEMGAPEFAESVAVVRAG